jgi:hypothetical protein
VTLKLLAAGVAALATISAAAAGMTSLAPVDQTVPQPGLMVFGAPLPLDPAPLPGSGELVGVLNGLQDPSVPFASKSNLIQGGVGGVESRVADRKLQKAAQNGQLPLSFNIANIQPAGAGTVSADVTASGPQLAPSTRNLSFINEDGWKLSRSSAMTLLQSFSG